MFTAATFGFLDELANNNNRAWFEANKMRYEALVREPALDFIEAMDPQLRAFAPSFYAEARKVGGSLMRVYRDTRFSRDKTPYKVNIGIQFRHKLGRDIHAPGFYVHIASDGCFLAIGCWRPESAPLGKIRDLIASNPEKWFSVRDDEKFTASWALGGDSLIRAPRGYAVDHPAIADIKRKDYIAMMPLSLEEVRGAGLVTLAGRRFSEAVPFMRFLCEALEVPY